MKSIKTARRRIQGWKMNTRKVAGTILGLLFAFATFLPVAHADLFDEAIKITFGQAVEIPGQVLPAGTYWFVLANHGSNQKVVQVFNADRTKVYATIVTAARERENEASNPTFTFAARPAGEPVAVLTWFYPNLLDGHEFLYSTQVEKELAQAKRETVVVGRTLAISTSHATTSAD
jgi:hypothetical protein